MVCKIFPGSKSSCFFFGLPFGLPDFPFWKRVAFGGFPRPTSYNFFETSACTLFGGNICFSSCWALHPGEFARPTDIVPRPIGTTHNAIDAVWGATQGIAVVCKFFK